MDLEEFEMYISYGRLSVTKAMNHVYSCQTNSFCEEKKQANESSISWHWQHQHSFEGLPAGRGTA